MTNDEVNRVIAEWVGGESDEPILVMDDEGYITAQVISDADKHEQIDYCSSLDPTVAAMKGRSNSQMVDRGLSFFHNGDIFLRPCDICGKIRGTTHQRHTFHSFRNHK